MAAVKSKTIKPPKRVKDKVGNSGGVEPAEALKRAAAVQEQMGGEVLESAVQLIEQISAQLPDGDGFLSDEPRKLIADVANELRGIGGTFGYPLVSLVADSLCKFLDPQEHSGSIEIGLIRLHIQAFHALIQDRVSGDGGQTGVELRALMAALAKRRVRP